MPSIGQQTALHTTSYVTSLLDLSVGLPYSHCCHSGQIQLLQMLWFSNIALTAVIYFTSKHKIGQTPF